MSHTSNDSGFAMIDALVALLLFALAVLAAIAALLQGMRATHAAVLNGRAVDLAADFLEQRRALPAGVAVESLLPDWNTRLNAALPAVSQTTALALVQPLLPASGDPP